MNISKVALFSILTLSAMPAFAVPGEVQIPLTGAQVLFQMFDNPGGGIPSGVPSLNLRNVRSTEPFVDATVGGMQIRYFDIEQAIKEEIKGAAPQQGQAITLIGSPGSMDWCRLYYDIFPTVSFQAKPQTLNITESSPGHLSASFDTVVTVSVHVQANIFGVPVLGDRHFEADITVMLAIHAALIDVGVWPPNTNDIFNSGNPPTINTNHVQLTLQQVGGNVQLTGLQEPIVVSSFVIGTAGILAAPATFGLSAILAVLAPIIAIAAPGVESTIENIMNAYLSQAIAAGITELDVQMREAVAGAGNQINTANALSTAAPGILAAATAFNTWMGSTFGTNFDVATRIDNAVVGAGLTVERAVGPATGSNVLLGRIMFPRYRCDYAPAEFIETTLECDGHTLWSSDIQAMRPTLTSINANLAGMNCATVFGNDVYARSYLGSDWNPPNGASPNWQTLVASMSSSTVMLVNEGGKSFYACDFALNALPSNIILDFGAKPGSALASKIVPTLNGDRLPAELVVDPSDYLARVHMVVRPTRGATLVLDEEGDPILGRTTIGSRGPQSTTLAVDCPMYALATNGGSAGYCSNPGSYESPCGDCY